MTRSGMAYTVCGQEVPQLQPMQESQTAFSSGMVNEGLRQAKMVMYRMQQHPAWLSLRVLVFNPVFAILCEF